MLRLKPQVAGSMALFEFLDAVALAVVFFAAEVNEVGDAIDIIKIPGVLFNAKPGAMVKGEGFRNAGQLGTVS